jgi:hypothetical protein
VALAAEREPSSLGLRKARSGCSDLAFRRAVLPEWFFRSAEVASVCTLFKAAMLSLARPSNMLISLSLERPCCSTASMQSTELAGAWICWATLAHVAPYLLGACPHLLGNSPPSGVTSGVAQLPPSCDRSAPVASHHPFLCTVPKPPLAARHTSRGDFSFGAFPWRALSTAHLAGAVPCRGCTETRVFSEAAEW